MHSWQGKVGDSKANQNILRAIVELYPCAVPSTYLLADALLHMDFALQGRLLKGDHEIEKHRSAIRQGVISKRLVGDLRYLSRSCLLYTSPSPRD
eukprot:11098545-Alexandrium_andersonii.AAC.1